MPFGGDKLESFRSIEMFDHFVLLEKKNSFEAVDAGLSEDLSSVLDKDKMLDSQNSENLRDFFKKLIETDTKIRKLKEQVNNNFKNSELDNSLRFKRSAKRKPKYFYILSHKKVDDSGSVKEQSKDDIRSKRHKNNNDTQVSGYVIEEEKVFVKYRPSQKRIFTKCSHNIDAKPHENQLKHPYYKHSQRLDDMLQGFRVMDTSDKVAGKDDKSTVPADITLAKVNTTFNNEKIDFFNPKKTFTKDEETENLLYKTTKSVENYDYDFFKMLSTSPVYDIAMSVSTFLNIEKDKNVLRPVNRKLMQIEENDDMIEYQDVKEVLSDDQQFPDDAEKEINRKKREETQTDLPENINPSRLDPQNIYNPNWKGPMPLYPDEINLMIKQAALQNINVQLPINTKTKRYEKDSAEKSLTDTQYLEDYIDNKYEKMVKVAQAYSDYGVLYDKKDAVTKGEIKDQTTNKLKTLWDNKNTFIERLRKASGEIRAGYKRDKSNTDNFLKAIHKHFKISNETSDDMKNSQSYYSTDLERNFTSNSINLPVISTQIPSKEKFSVSKVLRSLKSVNYENETSSEIVNKTDELNLHNNKTADVFSLLSVMADWFKSIAILSGEITTDIPNKTSTSNAKLSRTQTTNNITQNLMAKENDSDTIYPSYDSDMIENIAHRSRVLLSIDETLNNFNGSKNKFEAVAEKIVDKENSSEERNENVIPVVLAMLTDANSNKSDELKEIKENRTIVKRSVNNNKFTNWNDLYDDIEYGVKIDYLENVPRDKHSIKNCRKTLSKSKDWIKGKFHNITRKFHRKKKTKPKESKLKKLNDSKKCNDTSSYSKTQNHKSYRKRGIRNDKYDDGLDLKRTFEALTAKMKTVFQEAANAVRNSRNLNGQENNKEDAAGTSLMQQLVRLMSDLVDIQVQQKTCAKLPPDLRNFLEWLTSPTEINPRVDDLNPTLPFFKEDGDDEKSRFEKSTDGNFNLLEEDSEEDRTECLGTIRAIQDLIQEYEAMTDEDKSKMSGVKEYLENQLTFLNKKLNNIDDANIYKMYEKRALRQKRYSATERDNHNKMSKNSRIRKKLKKFFRRKHPTATVKPTRKYILTSKEYKKEENNKEATPKVVPMTEATRKTKEMF